MAIDIDAFSAIADRKAAEDKAQAEQQAVQPPVQQVAQPAPQLDADTQQQIPQPVQQRRKTGF
jgi:hypothetical protein